MARNKTIWLCSDCGWFGLMASVTCPQCQSRLARLDYDPEKGSREAARLVRQATENARYRQKDWVRF